MKCLVTGSSGFIGSHLVKALQEEGHNVEGLDINPRIFHNVTTKYTSILNEYDVTKAVEGFDFVFHLAGLLGTHELIDNTLNAVAINIGGTVNVLEACRKSGAKIILASKPNCWLNTYTITKEASESFTKMYREEHGVEMAILKWFNVYGPYQPLMESSGYRKFIPHAIVDAINGNAIRVYGSGNQTVDLIHVDDTVSALISIVNNWEKCEGNTFEAGDREISVNDVLDILVDITGTRCKVAYLDMRKGEPRDTKVSADTTKLREFTGWAPKVSLEDGLEDTVDWYKKNRGYR